MCFSISIDQWIIYFEGVRACTVEWAITELIKNPRIMIQVQQELNVVVGQDRLVTELDLPHLPYLQAVVKETLRLHPPTPLSLPRFAENSCEIFNYHIPKGATLLVIVEYICDNPGLPILFRTMLVILVFLPLLIFKFMKLRTIF